MGIRKLSVLGGVTAAFAVVVVSIANLTAGAQGAGSGFSLQISPATIVEEIKPGTSKEIDLKITNTNNITEHLAVKLREFSVDQATGEVKLGTKEPEGVADWVTFRGSDFTIEPGKTYNQKIHVALPDEVGFAYSFAVVISRATNEQSASGASLAGSVAVFSLISVDKPGAQRAFEIIDFKPKSAMFEYLPAEFDITFRNTGNTFVKPVGNLFIIRGKDEIGMIPISDQSGFLLPNTPRTVKAAWEQGFPAYRTTTDADGQQKRELIWDWTKITDFRIGQYTAKVVAVYNDGQRDVPIIKEVTFWVFPWRAVLFLIAVIALVVLIGHKLIQRKVRKAVARSKKS